MIARAPTIETERLILRAHRPDDFDACAALWADPIVTRFITGTPSPPSRTWGRVLQYAGLWALLGYGYWALEDKTSRRFVGELGFADFKRDIGPAMRDVPELGWALASSEHGKGFATEAVRAALVWGDGALDSKRTVCMIDAENVASIRVAERGGYRQFDAATIDGSELLFFERYAST